MTKPGQVSRGEFALATLDFLRSTDAFYREARSIRASGVPLRPGYDELVNLNMNASRRTVNECIRTLGGLPMRVSSDGGPEVLLVADTWVGHDPSSNDTGNLLWHIQGMPPTAVVSVEPSVIDEMSAEFMPPNEGTL